MNVWKEIKLGRVAKVISGYAFKSSDFMKQSGIPAIKIKNIKNGDIDLNECDYVGINFLRLNKKYHINKKDILVSLTGSHLTQPNSVVGRIAMYKHNFTSLLNQRAGKILVDDTLINVDYLYSYLSQNSIKESIALKARGAANQANISPGDVEDTDILLPPLSIQQRIASILSAYDDLIENNLKRIKLLEEIAQRTYEEWFVKFRINGEQIAINEKTGLPVGWERLKLIDVAAITMGQSPKSEFYNKEKKGLPFHQGVSDYGFRFPLNSTWSTEGNRLANKGEILFSVRAPVGRLNIAIEKIILGRGLCSISHKKGYTNSLFYQLQNIFFKDDLLGGGAIFASVTKSDVEKISIIEPDTIILSKYDEFASKINNQIENLTLQNLHLKESRDILLPRLMNGTIKVSES
jgi:type I restriction enzyme S subunit